MDMDGDGAVDVDDMDERQLLVGFVRRALTELAGKHHPMLLRTAAAAAAAAAAGDDGGDDVDCWLDRTVHWTTRSSSSRSTSKVSSSISRATTTTKTTTAATSSADENDNDKSGKPWNLEVRTAPAVFYRYAITNSSRKDNDNDEKKKKKKKKQHSSSSSSLTLKSPWGVERTFASAEALGDALLVALEDACRQHVDLQNVKHNSSESENDADKDDSYDCYHHDSSYYYHIRLQRPSGILCVATPSRVQQLWKNHHPFSRLLLPCPYCPAWCKTAVGVRWHVQQKHHHGLQYEQAVRDGKDPYSEQAIVVYSPKQNRRKTTTKATPATNANEGNDYCCSSNNKTTRIDSLSKKKNPSMATTTTNNNNNDPWECIQCGDLAALQCMVAEGRFDPKSAVDAKGASALLWAAGGGHLQMVQYLIEHAGCDPNFKQQGKRAFQGRTALHWACRNGHLPVVRYLLSLSSSLGQQQQQQQQQQQLDSTNSNNNKEGNDDESEQHILPRNVDIMAATADGTIAFHWAAWQNHQTILQAMVDIVKDDDDSEACPCHATAAAAAASTTTTAVTMVRHVNSYGCNAALWAAQGEGTPETLQWLQRIGCPLHVVNHAGHGILHKAAQRGRWDICKWYIQSIFQQIIQRIESMHPCATAATTKTSELDCFLLLIGPDNDGCLPSDLAGMEEHEELALFLADQEEQLAVCILESSSGNNYPPTSWIHRAPVPSKERIWEPWAGVARIRYACQI